MNIKPHPELSERYPAIDGIKKEHKGYEDADRYITEIIEQEAIRSDILEILNLNDNNFNEWYHTKKSTIERLLNDYKIVASVPHLRYASENQRLGLNAYSGLGGLIEILETGLEYLSVIKKIKDESREH